MALSAADLPGKLLGSARPRIAPPVPARHGLTRFRETAQGMGIELMPWQETAGKYLTATGPDAKHLYSEIAILVARQQGKTTLMKPLIVQALRDGKRVMHIAQTRELPRKMFGLIADVFANEPNMLPRRRGKIIWPRYGAGQEEIVLNNNACYRIAAGTTGGARGWTNDLVIIDELREIDSWDVIQAAQPTLRMSDDPLMVYLSNAGTEKSVVLNAVRARAGDDPNLAYLEWSAAPDRRADDRRGWVEANPAIGHYPAVLRDLERSYQAAKLSGMMAGFETESLCRWVATMRERFIDEAAWLGCEADDLGKQRNAYMGIALDPELNRASAALAWRLPDARMALRLLLDVREGPIDVTKLGERLRALQRSERVLGTGYDPLTDGQVIPHLIGKPEKITGKDHANASARFAGAVASATLLWQDANAVTDDLVWTTRKEHDESGSFQAVRADDERPITAALAAIRAVALASGRLSGGAQIW